VLITESVRERVNLHTYSRRELIPLVQPVRFSQRRKQAMEPVTARLTGQRARRPVIASGHNRSGGIVEYSAKGFKLQRPGFAATSLLL
jgi:hypothetical protein